VEVITGIIQECQVPAEGRSAPACGSQEGPEAARGSRYSALAESEALKVQARLEDLNVWERELVKESKIGSKTYTYWMASWREGDKTRNVHLGSTRKMDAEAARQKARVMKAEALGMRE